MSVTRAMIITCDICGKEYLIKDSFASPRIPEEWRVEGYNTYTARGEQGEATCPECTAIVKEAQAKYDNAVAEAKRAYKETLKTYKKTKPQATAEGVRK